MSTHYEERMEADLEDVRSKVSKVSDIVESQVERAVRALFARDRELASQVVMGDREVNRRIKQIDELCHAFIVRHAPTEGYLRRASAVLRFGVALERVGDYASSIARHVARLSAPPPDAVAGDLRTVADRARAALADALRAFHSEDLELATATLPVPDEQIDRVLSTLFAMGESREVGLHDAFGVGHVLNLLMRIGEQAANIREQTLFAVRGTIPEHGSFRVLFVDSDNTRASQLAEAEARRRYPRSGTYASAGFDPGDALDPAVAGFAAAEGLDLDGQAPKALSDVLDREERYNVLVLLEPAAVERLGRLPFRTTLVKWDVADAGDDLAELGAALGARIDDLMRMLAGPEAD